MSAVARVLIVEDEAETRQRLARAVAADSALELVAAVGDCASARAQCQRTPIQIALVDLGLPDGPGAELIRELRARDPDMLFMVITSLADEVSVMQAIEAGACAYLLKDASLARVAAAIHETLAGGSPISPGIARHLLKRVQKSPQVEAPAAPPLLALSQRESAVLNLVAKGYAYAEIGSALGISVNTVGTYVRLMYRKLGVNSRGEAVFEALQQGLIVEPTRARPH